MLPHNRLLPVLSAAMVFLAALAGAGSLAAASLANHWREAAAGTTIQVPQDEAPAAAALLGPATHRMSPAEMASALKPWLGGDTATIAMPLPAVITLPGNPPPNLEQALARAAPGAVVVRDTVWQQRAAVLADSLQSGAALAAGVVAFVAVGMVAAATIAGLSGQQEAIETVHYLGATDGQIAGRLAGAASAHALAGSAAGSVAAMPVLLVLARMTAPFQPSPGAAPHVLLPAVWALLVALPLAAGLTVWLTAHATMRVRLRRLP